ncbi:MAG: KEOPS complex N(6)-L-threonylcarbamoyladenine synthase Kae1 [Nanoarchaeota archaeon]
MSIILGVESTAHTFGVGVVKNGKILSNVISNFTTKKGGLIPMDVAKHHFEKKHEVYFEALSKAKISEEEIDAIAFSQGPGLAPCLLEGLKFVKELSIKLKKSIIPVNHCVAHLEIGTQGCTPKDFKKKSLLRAKTTGAKNPVMLYASGANTQVIAYASGKYRVFGETLDIGVGNFIDTFARYAGIGFPGGPAIEKLALSSKTPPAYTREVREPAKAGPKKFIELPYTIKGMDVAFSGILTNLKQKLDSRQYNLNDLAYSLQEFVFAMLVETAERALAHTGKNELLLAGGVACNKRLQEMCRIMCDERGAKFFCPEKSLLVDNGAMIAYLGEIMHNSEIKFSYKNLDEVDIKPQQRTDEVNVNWK